MAMESQDENTSHFLILSGGAFRGAFQYWVIVHLLALYIFRIIAGVSVGSINGIMAAMDKMKELLEFWDAVDGIKGFLKFRLLWLIGYLTGIVGILEGLGFRIIGGLYSMSPLQEKLKGLVFLKDVKIPFVAGVVAANSGRYHNLDTRAMKTDHRARMAVTASSCMAPFMQPPLIHLEKEPGEEMAEPEIGFDGGYRNIFPIPWKEIEAAKAEGKRIVIHAIGCTPLERIHRVQSKKVDGPVEMGLRSIEIFEAEIYDGDILQMREAVGVDGELHLWVPHPLDEAEAKRRGFDTVEEAEEAEIAELKPLGLTPIEIPGDSFDASKNTIQGRLRESKRMVERGPTIYSGLESRE
jgi:predicted acylesterase/phospholipase RssA